MILIMKLKIEEKAILEHIHVGLLCKVYFDKGHSG